MFRTAKYHPRILNLVEIDHKRKLTRIEKNP